MNKLILVFVVLCCSGCASAVNKHELLQAQLSMPIECMMAEEQIESLHSYEVDSTEQFANTVASILPTSIIFNLLTGEYTSRLKLANGEYNQQVSNRIAEIKQKCSDIGQHQGTKLVMVK